MSAGLSCRAANARAKEGQDAIRLGFRRANYGESNSNEDGSQYGPST